MNAKPPIRQRDSYFIRKPRKRRLASNQIYRIIDSSMVPQFVMLILIVVPYLLYDRRTFAQLGAFLITPVVAKLDHIGISIILIILVLFVTAITRISVSSGNPSHIGSGSFSRLSRGGYILTFGAVLISVIAHIYLLVTSGSAYVSGGLLEARAQIANGIGIFLRFYMFAAPVLFCTRQNRRSSWLILIALGLLVTARAFVLSERTAIFEYIATFIIVLRITRITVNVKYLMIAAFSLYIGFSALVEIRLLQQNTRNAALVDRGAARTDLGLIAYYADTVNKAYFAAGLTIGGSEPNWAGPLRALRGAQVIDTTYYDRVVSTGTGASELNNPGGLAQDIEDFGVLGAVIALIAKTVISTLVFEKSRKSVFFISLFPLFYIRTLEYPRFEYFSLPYGLFTLAFALLYLLMIYSIFMPRKVSKFSTKSSDVNRKHFRGTNI